MILTIFLIAVSASFFVGTFLSLRHTLPNRYLHYEMFRLIALSFQENLNVWVLGGVLIACGLGILYVIGKLLGRIPYKNLVWTCGICLGLFFTVGWAINRYLLPYRYHPISLLANAGLVLLLIFLGRRLVKIRVGEKILYRIALMQKRLAQVFSTKLMRILGGSLRRTSVLVVVLLLVLNLILFIDGRINLPKELNVVWIVIDALRTDHLGSYGYERDTSPFIDTFARENVLFKHAFSQESYTSASVASYFTSTYPIVHKDLYNIDILESRFVTLAEILKNANYQTAAVVFNGPLRREFNKGQGFDYYDYMKGGRNMTLSPHEAYETAGKIFEKMQRYLKKNQKRPMLLYLHYLDVHDWYAPPPPYHKLFLPPGVEPVVDMLYPDKKELPQTRENRDLVISQYDGEIKYTDRQIKKMLELLESYNITANNSIIIISADHGEEFFDYHPEDPGGRAHGRTLYNEQIHVPLIMSFPELVPKKNVIDSSVELIDVSPTILDFLAIDYEKYRQFQGRSLLPALQNHDPISNLVYSGGNHGRGVIIEGEWKYYFYDTSPKTDRFETYKKPLEDYEYVFGEELYNITIDPEETENLIEQEKEVAWNLKEKLWELKERFASTQKGKSIKLSEQAIEDLRSLGYVR